MIFILENEEYMEAFKAAAERRSSFAPEEIVSFLANWLASRGDLIAPADRDKLIAAGAVITELTRESQWLRGREQAEYFEITRQLKAASDECDNGQSDGSINRL